jgi:5-methylcytosine-specific restriction endonuclease McrA
MRYCPIITIEIEQARFDTQKMNNPQIKGIEYQQGTLMGYEVRQYLLEKWGNQCAYCDAKDVPLEIEHIQPKSKGGSDRVSNLTLACHDCNQKKADQPVTEFLSDKSKLDRILAQAKVPLKDAAAVNSTRFAIVEVAKNLCNSVKCWTGGRTKFNRCQQGLEKSHSIDAACVGESAASIKIKTKQALIVTCKGHGNRQARRVNAYGFPAVKKAKDTFTHATAGDLVRVTLDKDRKNVLKGIYTARVKTPTTKGIEVVINGFRVTISSMKNVKFIHQADGYAYGF